MILFGGELELNDIKRSTNRSQNATQISAKEMQTEFVIVPLTRNDFKKLSDPLFL